MFTAFFLLVTLLTAGVLVFFLLRAGTARANSVWALAALLPVLAALTASFAGQARATQTLQAYAPVPTAVDIFTGQRQYRAILPANDAACLERNIRLNWEGQLNTPQGFIPINKDSRVDGALPPANVVEALSVRGQLHCAAFSGKKRAVK